MVPLTEIFVFIDDFCKLFVEYTQQILVTNAQSKKRKRLRQISLSEIMTIIVLYHLSRYKTFKDFYMNSVLITYRKEFPNAVSYSRFITLMKDAFMPLLILLLGIRGEETGIYYIDSTKLTVCHNLRIHRNKVFKDAAKRGKTSTGWFFGFKLHVVVNNKGEIMNFVLTPGNVHDTKPVETLVKHLNGWLFGDRGYISKELNKTLLEKGIELITNIKKGMKKVILEAVKKYLLKKKIYYRDYI
jgi:hypothetical protein